MAVILKATKREDLTGSATKAIRESGFIPGVVYAKGEAAQAISVSNLDLLKTVRDEGRHAVITMDIENGEKVDVMLHEYQTHPVRQDVIHADFYEIDLKAEMDVFVTLNLVGEAQGSKDGGILQQPLFEIEVRAIPNEIPEEITVDVSALEIGDSLSIEDIEASSTYTLLDDPETTIAVVLPPQEEEEETDLDADVSVEPELVGAEDDDEEEDVE